MPRKLVRQATSPVGDQKSIVDAESLYGDSVLVNGVDQQAERRAHMRAQTTARQASEQRYGQHRTGLTVGDQFTRLGTMQRRDAQRRDDLATIDANHRAWLHNSGADTVTDSEPDDV